jgi:hypothetical protein
MKNYVIAFCGMLLTLIRLSSSVTAQSNLVVNGDFEDRIGCPNNNQFINNGQLIGCSNPAGHTVEYFNSCNTGTLSTPMNGVGFQHPLSGEGYIGMCLWQDTLVRDFIQIRLKWSLIKNHNYHFSCYLSKAEFLELATSSFGVYFSEDSVHLPNEFILPFTPQLNNSSGYFCDTALWMNFTGNYLASGGESYVILGNFNDTPNSEIVQLYPIAPNHNSAYYYIDDVSLIDLDSALNVEEHSLQRKFALFPNPAQQGARIASEQAMQTIQLFDVQGKLWHRNTVNGLQNYELNTTHLSAGVYIVEIVFSDGMLSRQRLVILDE